MVAIFTEKSTLEKTTTRRRLHMLLRYTDLRLPSLHMNDKKLVRSLALKAKVRRMWEQDTTIE